MVRHITDYVLYRWRYVLGYSIASALLLALLAVAWLLIPGGLTNGEMASTVTSSSINFTLDGFQPESVINLPYHLVQRASFALFGISELSIKLPSIILGALSALGILLLLRVWFRPNAAVIATVLTITAGQFLFIVQDGTPTIVYLFGSVWLLVAALMVSRQATGLFLWKIVMCGIVALSLYTPLAIYILLALASAVILHPHLRFIVRNLSKPRLILAGFCGLLLLAPLIYSLVKMPQLALQLLGMPTTMPDVVGNSVSLVQQFLHISNESNNLSMLPIYSLGIAILMALGLVRLFATRYTARSYITIAWIVLLVPIMLINPQHLYITFVPAVLLTAMGISMLLHQWYSLFPRNPYARIAGLIPLTILIGGMVFSGIDHYLNAYIYSPQLASSFSHDLRLLQKQLPKEGNTTLVVEPAQAAFYGAVGKYTPRLTIASGGAVLAPGSTIITTPAARSASYGDVAAIVTSGSAQNANRFYIYKTGAR